MAVINFLNWLDGILWGTPFLIFCMVLGLYFMLRGGFFPFRHFGHILKNTVFEKATQNDKNGNGKISPYRAFCIGLGGAVGMGNISGVATSVAVGGPGAIFWMLVWAFFGMMLKMAEISLGLYYRRKDSNGKYVGSAMDYMERGIKGEQGKKIGGPLSVLFAIGLFMQFTQGSGSYTVAETLNASFGFNIMAVGIIYTAFVLFLIIRGENAIGRMAEKIVPVMVRHLSAGHRCHHSHEHHQRTLHAGGHFPGRILRHRCCRRIRRRCSFSGDPAGCFPVYLF